MAARKNNFRMTEWLLNHGADFMIINEAGRIPNDEATDLKVKLLLFKCNNYFKLC